MKHIFSLCTFIILFLLTAGANFAWGEECFSFTIAETAQSWSNVASSEEKPLSSYCTDIDGGSIYAGHNNGSNQTLELYKQSNVIYYKLGGANIYLKIALNTPLTAGDTITIGSYSTGHEFYITASNAVKPASGAPITSSQTYVVQEDDVLDGQSVIYIWRGSGTTMYIKSASIVCSTDCTPATLAWVTAPANGAVGDADITLTVNKGESTGIVTFSSSQTSVATVIGGVLHYVASGTTTITATLASDDTYCQKSISQNITVTGGTTPDPGSGELTNTTAYICCGSDYEWIHDGAVRASYSNVTSSKSDKYVNTNGKTYKLALTCLKASSHSAATPVTLNLVTGETYTWNINGHSYLITRPGVYMDTVYHEQIDDCIKVINYLVVNGDTTAFYCKDEGKYVWEQFPEKTTTSSSATLTIDINTETLHAAGASDKTPKYRITNHVTREESSSSTTKAQINAGESYDWFGHTYTHWGTYRDTLVNQWGCDSVGQLVLSVCTPAADRVSELTIVTNKPYFWPNTGMAYSVSGDYQFETVSVGGCDSTVTLHLTIEPTVPGDTVATICEGEPLLWHGTTYSASGLYADSEGHKLLLTVTPLPNVVTCEDRYITAGEHTELSVTGAEYYVWSPATTLSNKAIDKPTASPTVSTQYTVKGYQPADGNMVMNGEFEKPDFAYTDYTTRGFDTEMTNPRNSTNKYGTYAVTADPSNESGWGTNFGSYKDHTLGNKGTGHYMVVDGSTHPETVVWESNITVVPNTIYIFSAWFMTVGTLKGDGDRALLQFFINDEQVGAIRKAPNTKGVWEQYYEVWDSGESTTAKLTIKNQNEGTDGNDFALDDITFRGLSPCFDEDTVNILICTHTVVDTTVNRTDLPYLWEGHTLTTDTTIVDTLVSSTNFRDSIVTLTLHVADVFTIHVEPDCTYTIDGQREEDDPEAKLFTLTLVGDDGCTQTITAHYRPGDEVILTAAQDECFHFKWTHGGENNTNATYPFTMTAINEHNVMGAEYTRYHYQTTVHFNEWMGQITR